MNNNNFIITTDSSCDLPQNLCQNYNLNILPMYYCIDNQVFSALDMPEINFETNQISTIAANIEDCNIFLKSVLRQSSNIIHISFSSALSSTYQNMCICANELNKSNRNYNISVIDSISASLGQGLIVLKALEYAKYHSYEDVIDYIEKIKHCIAHFFTVDNLLSLQKGGRISKKEAIIGNIIGIKPILNMNDAGQLILYNKARCRKKSLLFLINALKENLKLFPTDNHIISISHCQSLEDANHIKEEILKYYPEIKIVLGSINPAIAIHSGIGTVAVFCHTEKRPETATK